jgi:hypothetical protein
MKAFSITDPWNKRSVEWQLQRRTESLICSYEFLITSVIMQNFLSNRTYKPWYRWGSTELTSFCSTASHLVWKPTQCSHSALTDKPLCMKSTYTLLLSVLWCRDTLIGNDRKTSLIAIHKLQYTKGVFFTVRLATKNSNRGTLFSVNCDAVDSWDGIQKGRQLVVKENTEAEDRGQRTVVRTQRTGKTQYML